MKRAILYILKLYQRTISPDHGLVDYGLARCRFYPSCSQYAHDAIVANSLGVAMLKTLWRIARCNPFSAGGVDYPNP